MKRSILSLLLSFSAAFTSACFEAGNMSVQIKETGLAENVLSVRALTGDGAVHLEWELPSDAKGVSIRRDTMPPFSVTSGTEIYCGPAMSYIDTTVEVGKSYYYLVVAIDNNMNFAGGVNISQTVVNYGFLNTKYGEYTSGMILAYDDDGLYLKSYSTSARWSIEKRSRNNGNPVSLFGSDGVLTLSPTNTDDDNLNGVLVDGDYLFLYGRIDDSSDTLNDQCLILKINKNTGTSETAFGDHGEVLIKPESFNNFIDLIIDGDFLYAITGSGSGNITKINKITGALETSFAENGTFNQESNYSVVNAEIDGNYIYLYGCTYHSGDPTTYQWSIQKINKTSGVPETSFGNSGVLTGSVVSYYVTIYDIIVNGDYLYFSLDDISLGATNRQWHIEKRNKISGALDTSFDGDGILTVNPSTYNDDLGFYNFLKFQCLLIDGDYIYLAGTDSSPGFENIQCRIEKRLKTTGALDTSFDGDGILTINPSTGEDYLSSLIIDGDYLLISGCPFTSDDSSYGYVEKFHKDTGSHDTSFGIDGVYKYTPSYATNYFGIYMLILENDLYINCMENHVINKNTGILRGGGTLFENPAPEVK